MHLVKTAKVSSKGQITLPQRVRSALGTDLVRIVLDNGDVRIEPVKNVAGSLGKYARKSAVPFKAEREQAWESVVREKYKRR